MSTFRTDKIRGKHPITAKRGINESDFTEPVGDVIRQKVPKPSLFKRIFSNNAREHGRSLQISVHLITPRIIEMNRLEDRFRLQTHKYDFGAYLFTVKKMLEQEEDIEHILKKYHLNHDKGKSEVYSILQKHFKVFEKMQVNTHVPFDSLNKKWDEKQLKFLSERKLIINSQDDYKRLKNINTDKIKKELMELDNAKKVI